MAAVLTKGWNTKFKEKEVHLMSFTSLILLSGTVFGVKVLIVDHANLVTPATRENDCFGLCGKEPQAVFVYKSIFHDHG